MKDLLRRSLSLFVIALLSLTAAGCDDSREDVANDMLDTITAMNAELESVNDRESAEAAKPRVSALAQEMQSIQQRMDAMGEGNVDEAFVEDFRERIEPELNKLIQNMVRVSMNTDTREVLGPVFQDMDARP